MVSLYSNIQLLSANKTMFRPTTKPGKCLYTVLSLLQKAIRRNHKDWAIWAVSELNGKWYKLAWKRLLIITCEDVGELATSQIISYMRSAFQEQTSQAHYLAKATLLLCDAIKSRDCDNFIFTHYGNHIPSQNEIESRLALVTQEDTAKFETYLSEPRKSSMMFPFTIEDYLFMDSKITMRHEKTLLPTSNGVTRNGYGVTAAIAILHRAIEEKDCVWAGWAVCELERGGYDATWQYLLDRIETTDTNETIKREAYSLLRMTAILNAKKKASEAGGSLPLLKLVFLLCEKDKSILGVHRDIADSDVEKAMLNSGAMPGMEYPDYTWCVHTIQGKRLGRTTNSFLFSETESLEPKSLHDLFDPENGVDYSESCKSILGR